jgi:pyridoxine/pyridoxamine 5'-phosphate oxidase
MDYENPELTLDSISNDPFEEFSTWIKTSLEVETGIEPQAMCISTVNP